MKKLSISSSGLARRCSCRPWATISIWLVLIAVSAGLTFTLLSGALTTDESFTNEPESKRAENLIEERLRPEKIEEIVVVSSPKLTVDSPAYKRKVEALFNGITALGKDVVAEGTNYYVKRNKLLVSADRHATTLPFVMTGDQDTASDNIDGVLEVVKAANRDPEFEVSTAGDASIGKDFKEISQKDLKTGEIVGVTAALLILVLVFGAVVASLVPIALAIFSILVALGISSLVGQAFDLSFFITNMVVMMGLAVGIDYSLFIVSRYREERYQGRKKSDAISAAGATAGRAVLFSGVTVVIALLGMLIVPTNIFRSLAIGAIAVVLVSVFAALTLLPAMLGLLGDRINSLRVPFFGRLAQAAAEGAGGGFWGRVARGVMRRPVISLIVSAGILIAAAFPTLDINTGAAGVNTLPEDRSQSKRAFTILDQKFYAGRITPTEIVIDGDARSKSVLAAVKRLNRSLPKSTFGQMSVEMNRARDLTVVSVPVAGDATDKGAIGAVRELRSQYIPKAFTGTDVEVQVTGYTALNIDFFDLTNFYWPIVVALVLILSFILLTVAFRSIVVPIMSIFVNLLSVGAAYGLLVLVFQKGFANDLLRFHQIDVIETWIPLFLFTILFGLSMDYHVFLLSRIRERYDQTRDNRGSVAFGVSSTARIITGAALIMVSVFGGFSAGDLVAFEQFGFGLAVAVLIDATVVRSVLVPATMRLLGDRTWFLPTWLEWLPAIPIETAPAQDAPQHKRQ